MFIYAANIWLLEIAFKRALDKNYPIVKLFCVTYTDVFSYRHYKEHMKLIAY